MFLTKLPRKLYSAITALSKPLRSPAPQTSLSTSSCIDPLGRILTYFAVFELPNELILLILSHVSPEVQFIGYYTRFNVQYDLFVVSCHRDRVGFLRPLSMTCKAMRLRLIPFIWEHLHFFLHCGIWGRQATARLKTLMGALHANMSLAITVKCFSARFSFVGFD